jgi:hypothetical protein
MTNSMSLTILVGVLSSTVLSQVSGGNASGSSIAEGIQRGNIEAILDAGKSDDPSFIPKIVNYRRRVGKHIEMHEARAIQLALAKLGQPAEQRQIRCEFLFGSPSVQYDAVDKLVYVGGWFSLQAVTEVLNNPEYKAAGDRAGAFMPLGWYTVQKLPTMIPNPPSIESGKLVPGAPSDMQRQQQWKDWIIAHRDSLRTLAPTGDGVETSPSSCEATLRKDSTFDHSVSRKEVRKGSKNAISSQ